VLQWGVACYSVLQRVAVSFNPCDGLNSCDGLKSCDGLSC